MPTPDPNPDITSREDIATLLRHFYGRATVDPIIGFYFSQLSQFDIESHLPRVCDFWMGQLFGEIGYQGRNFEVHQALHRQTALTPHHFHRWLHLFNDSITTLYSGPIANTMALRAQRIAGSMAAALDKQPTPEVESEGVFIPHPDDYPQ